MESVQYHENHVKSLMIFHKNGDWITRLPTQMGSPRRSLSLNHWGTGEKSPKNMLFNYWRSVSISSFCHIYSMWMYLGTIWCGALRIFGRETRKWLEKPTLTKEQHVTSLVQFPTAKGLQFASGLDANCGFGSSAETPANDPPSLAGGLFCHLKINSMIVSSRKGWKQL